MSLQAKTFLNLLAGGLAGLLAWILTDVTGWYSAHFHAGALVSTSDPSYLFYGALFGLLLGLMLGGVDALSLDSPRQAAAALGLGAGIGAVGGALGLGVGQTVYAALGGSDAGSDSPGHFFLQLVARAIGWGVIGAIVGAAQGAARRSPVIVRQGAFGGLVGGLLGGTAFQVVADVFATIPHVDVVSRLTALAATGALTGFFVGLVQNLFKQAWIKVMVGRNEGKEYLIAKPVLTIGRSELSDIGLFGDPSVAPTHAVVESLPGQSRHRLRHVAGGQGPHAFPPTVVNGRPVTAEQWLTDGDTIQIGGRTLRFEEKATRGARSTPSPALPLRQGEGVRDYPTSPSPPPYEGGGRGEVPGRGAAGGRPPLAAPPEVVAQMGDAPPPASEPTTVLSQFSQSVTVRDFGGIAPVAPSALAPPELTAMGTGGASEATGTGSRLTAVGGPYAGQSFPLSHLPVTLGRSRERDIPLSADSSVSRTHARVAWESGRHIVADDGSSNGTLVNNVRLSAPRPLRPGDVIQMGETSLRYE